MEEGMTSNGEWYDQSLDLGLAEAELDAWNPQAEAEREREDQAKLERFFEGE